MSAATALPSTMRAVIAEAGSCKLVERPLPVASRGEYLIRAEYSAINRADTLQRKGLYAPPAGSTDILGLEVVGEIVAANVDVDSEGSSSSAAKSAPAFAVGERVMALLSGGGNAEYVAVPSGQLMRIPSSMDWRSAAAVPETWLTAFQLLHFIGNAKAGETVIILAAGSGVGTAAVQLAIGAGCRVVAVAGSDDKLAAVRKLADETIAAIRSAEGGTDAAHVGTVVATINYKTTPAWAAPVLGCTDGKFANLLLDPVGGSFWAQSVEALGQDGRWVVYGTMGGGAVDGALLTAVLRKRLSITGTTLRNRSNAYKAELTSAFAATALPRLAAGIYKPIVSAEFSLAEISAAHALMESNETIGKTVIRIA